MIPFQTIHSSNYLWDRIHYELRGTTAGESSVQTSSLTSDHYCIIQCLLKHWYSSWILTTIIIGKWLTVITMLSLFSEVNSWCKTCNFHTWNINEQWYVRRSLTTVSHPQVWTSSRTYRSVTASIISWQYSIYYHATMTLPHQSDSWFPLSINRSCKLKITVNIIFLVIASSIFILFYHTSMTFNNPGIPSHSLSWG